MEQLNFDSETKTDIAIKFIRRYEPAEGYFLGFSGGKDSVVLYDIVIRSGVKFKAYYSCTGIDPPEITRFIRQNYSDVQWLFPKQSFFKELIKRGYPTIFQRWCCDFLKKAPAKNIQLKHRLMGIRAEESFKRKKRGDINCSPKYTTYNPIFFWLEYEIWEYVERNNLPYCSLYDEGFDRIGCVICPFICGTNSWKLKQHQNRFPKQYKAFERAMTELWDQRVWWEKTKKGYARLPEEFIQNWYKRIM